MTRYIVAYEDKAPFPGVFLTKGCFSVNRDLIPVSTPNWGNPPIGVAEKFERDEETNAVSFEIRFVDDRKAKDENFSVFAKDLVTDTIDGVMVVKKANIVGITLLDS